MRLKELRVSKFLSVRELAKRAGIATSTITAIENGRELPSTRTTRKLAEALGVAATEIDEVKAAMERALSGRKAAAKD